jgi:prolyl-tRNA synthetase
LVGDSFSFDLTPEGLNESYENHRNAYRRILERCVIEYVDAEGRFMVECAAGEDSIVRGKDYAASLEDAVSIPKPPETPDPAGDLAPEEFHTPGRKTIAAVAEFTGLPETSQMKSLVMMADRTPVLALVRGDHTLSETKLSGILCGIEVRPAQPEEIRERFGADAGSLGPVGVRNVRILADKALRGRRNMICGANKNDYHLRHVTPCEDFAAEFLDLRQAAVGDTCVTGGGALTLHPAIETGYLRKLGPQFAASMGLRMSNETGGEVAPLLGRYGISIERILRSAAEQHHDQNGLALPRAIAPFAVIVTPVNFNDEPLRRAAVEIYSALRAAGLEALLDDRDERPGVKFKDADLIGVPYRITIGSKKLGQGMVEVAGRRKGESSDVPLSQCVEAVSQ